MEHGLPCLHERIGTATFRLNQIAPVAGALARLGRPAEALDVVDLDHGPLTALVQRKVRGQLSRSIAYILDSLGDDDLVPELIGSSLAGEDRVSWAPIRYETAPLVGGIDRLDELTDAAEQQPDSAHDELLRTAYDRAETLIRA